MYATIQERILQILRDGQLTEDGKYISWQTVVGASHSDGSDQGVIQSDFYDYIDSIATHVRFPSASTTPGSTT